jgi:hypothetical protein
MIPLPTYIESLLPFFLIQEGQLVAEKGSHEAVVYNLVPPGGIAQAELMKVSFRFLQSLCHLAALRQQNS